MDLALLNLRDAAAVISVFEEGARANLNAPCRLGSIDVLKAPGKLIATGDLHDNPLHMIKVVEAAGMGDNATPGEDGPHLILQEIIHPPGLINGMDFSFRALARVAALKAAFPQRVHVLLGNHELAQVLGTLIMKDGVRSVEAFSEGLAYAYGDRADDVAAAIRAFVFSMPLALRLECSGGRRILCSHSLPSAAAMARFDATILSRPLEERDYEPLKGSAYTMVWGRNHDAELLEDLVERWGVNMFIMGHEKAERGIRLVAPNLVILNSDHAGGVYLPIDLDHPPSFDDVANQVVRLSD